MIQTSTIDKLLKIQYSNTVADQIGHKVSEWHEQIKGNVKSAGGKEYYQPIRLSLNGGVGFSNEVDLPGEASAHLESFKLTTKNIFGTFGISLKALRTDSTPEKIVKLLNDEMDTLVKSVNYHLARSLEMKSDGVLCKVANALATAGTTLSVDNTQFIEDGMVISIYTGTVKNHDVRVKYVDHSAKTLTLESAVTAAKGDVITNIGSLNQEFTGFGDIFSTTGTIYGLNKENFKRLIPYMKTSAGAISDLLILDMINECEKRSGVKIDFLNCSYDVITKYLQMKQANSMNVATMEIKGGYTTMTFNGMIPMVKSRFAPEGTMDVLDSKTFSMYNLGKGGFVDEAGGILQQLPGKASFAGTYAMFSEQYCCVPGGQGRLSGLTAAAA